MFVNSRANSKILYNQNKKYMNRNSEQNTLNTKLSASRNGSGIKFLRRRGIARLFFGRIKI